MSVGSSDLLKCSQNDIVCQVRH